MRHQRWPIRCYLAKVMIRILHRPVYPLLNASAVFSFALLMGSEQIIGVAGVEIRIKDFKEFLAFLELKDSLCPAA